MRIALTDHKVVGNFTNPGSNGFGLAPSLPVVQKSKPKDAMKSLLVILFQFVVVFSWAQKPGTIWPDGVPGKDYNLYNAQGKKEGLWIQALANSKNLFSKGYFKNGVPTGHWEKYYDDGALWTVQNFKSSDSIETILYHADGKTVGSKGYYVKRKKEGNWKLYNLNSVLITDENYSDSLLHGVCKYYYENGKPLKTEVYKRGMKEGPFTEYFENGKKRAEGTYLLDEKNGDYKSWFEDGSLDSEGKFVKGHMDGTWYYYNEDGSPKVAINYNMGTEVKRKYQNGTFRENYDSGIPKNEYTWEDAKKNGPFVEWYDKGEYVLEDADDPALKKENYQKLVLKGTQEKVKGDYFNDQLEGEVIYFQENGSILKIETWSEGKLISTRGAGQ